MATTASPMSGAAQIAVTPSPNKFKFGRIGLTKSMSKEKAACEFSNDDLVEGDLPSLVTRSSAYKKPSSVRSVDNPVVVTPNNRDSTPTHTNKDKRGRALFRKRKGQDQGMAMRKKGENVTIEARRLSPQSKRKHKIFWSQMESDDGNSSTEDDAPDDEKPDLPDDEKQDLQIVTRGRRLTRDVELFERDVADKTHGIITVLTELCTDCRWADDEKKTRNEKPDYVKHNLRPSFSENEPVAVNRSRAIIDDDGSYSKQDDESLPSKETMDASVRSNSAYHTDAFENTAIEVEYYDAGFPDDETVDDLVEPQQTGEGFLQLDTSGDVANFTTPREKALSDIGGTQNKEYLISNSKSWSVPDKSAYLQAMTKKAKEDFIKRKNAEQINGNVALDDSVDDVLGEMGNTPPKSAPAKSENALRMTQSFESVVTPKTKEKETGRFISPIGVSEFPDIDLSGAGNLVDREASSDVGLGSKKPLLLKKVQSELPPSNAPLAKQKRFASLKILKPGFAKTDRAGSKHLELDAPYDMSSKGSFRSFRKKKKARNGAFYKIDDGEEDEEESADMQPLHDNLVNVEKKEYRPDDDIFDFEDDGEDHVVNDVTPASSVNLDPKEDSCDISILGSMVGHGDGATVYSSRSMYTTGTNGTNLSTSTRRRHRGAAKHRISDVNTDSKRPSGWLESIKAAAEQSDRRWDPKLGWIDYIEPNDQEEEEVQLNKERIGRLKTPNFKGAGRGGHQNDDASMRSDDRSVSSQVPFPESWEKDRQRMLRDDDGVASVMTEVVSNKPRTLKNHKQMLQDDDGVASRSAVRDVVSNKTGKQNDDHKFADEGPSVKTEYDYLGVEDTIEECSEEESDSDNNSDSRDRLQPSRLGHISVSSEETPAIPEKGKLFEWIGKMDLGAGGTPQSHRPKSTFSSLDDAEKKSTSQESDGDDFGQNNGSFDFSATGSAKDLNEEGVGSFEDDDGFVVIEESKGLGFDKKKLRSSPSSAVKNSLEEVKGNVSTLELEKKKRKSFQVSKELQEVEEKITGFVKRPSAIDSHSVEADRSVMSSTSMTSKAKDWVKKIEDKKNAPKSGQSRENSPSLAMFVSAADDNSTVEYKKKHDTDINDADSLFDFEMQPKSKTYRRKDGEMAAPHLSKVEKNDGKRFRKRVNDSVVMSEITSQSDVSDGVPRNSKYGSFLSRLQSCASSPVFEENERGQSMPQAHLAFLRNSTKDSKDNGIISLIRKQALCGGTANVQESDNKYLPPRVPYTANSETKRGSNVASSYLQAVKQNTVSKRDWGKKESDKVKRVSSTTSDTSSKSESWQKFLEKRNRALASGASISSSSNNSSAVEDYASAKVNEVVSKVSREGLEINVARHNRAKSAARLRPPSRSNQIPRSLSAGRSRPFSSDSSQSLSKNDAAKAAEDLAAAKVEAMMSMISSSHLEGEI